MAKQIFHDPLQARWRRVRRVFDATAIGFSLLVIFFIYSALRNEPLPDLSFRAEKRPYHALKEGEKEKAREKRRLATMARVGHRRKSRKAPSQVVLNSEEGVRAAFYVAWDAASYSSLREYARQIDLLFPTWLQVLTPDGHLQAVDSQTNTMFDVIQARQRSPGGHPGHAVSEDGRHQHGGLSRRPEFRWNGFHPDRRFPEQCNGAGAVSARD